MVITRRRASGTKMRDATKCCRHLCLPRRRNLPKLLKFPIRSKSFYSLRFTMHTWLCLCGSTPSMSNQIISKTKHALRKSNSKGCNHVIRNLPVCSQTVTITSTVTFQCQIVAAICTFCAGNVWQVPSIAA